MATLVCSFCDLPYALLASKLAAQAPAGGGESHSSGQGLCWDLHQGLQITPPMLRF